MLINMFFFFQAEDGIRDVAVTGVQTCALPICGGTLGWGRGDRGTLALDFDADSLNSLDSLLSWVTGSDMTAGGDPGDPDDRAVKPLTGAAPGLLSHHGAHGSPGPLGPAGPRRPPWGG